jgi:type IV pilus assembly protein PilM
VLRRSAWLAPRPPAVAIEIATGRVSVVGIVWSGSGLTVSGQASETLSADAVVPALSGPNIRQPSVVSDAIGHALERAGLGRPRRVALVVPDSVARVSLLLFQELPARLDERDQFIRWQLRKSTPFPIDDAQVTYFPTGGEGAAASLAAVVARREVMAEYEGAISALGLHAGIVDLASFNVMNAIVGAGGAARGDWLLVHRAAEATTLAILRGDQLMFYRHRTAGDEEPLGALVHQTAMYHEDRLGGGAFDRVWLSGAGTETPDARAEIGARLGVPADTLDVPASVDLRERLGIPPGLADALTAPVGILIRERAA